MFHRFSGGVRPAPHKEATRKQESTPMVTPPKQVVLAVCAPLVRVGERVTLGQMLCPGQEGRGAVHASVSGKVAALEERMQIDGQAALSLVLENDGQDTAGVTGRRAAPETAPGKLNRGELYESLRLADIGNMGGGSVLDKLLRGQDRVDTLIINGAECEPYCTADHRLMLERTEAVLTGTRLLARALGLDHAVIAVEGDKYDAITALRALLPLRGGDVEVRVLRTRYPQGAEGPLIQRVTGRRVPRGGLPEDVSCAVFHVTIAAAVYDAVYEGKPVTDRIVTVTGSAVARPKNLLVPIGTPLSDLIREAGDWKEHPERVLAGGGMMGLAQTDLAVPITWDTGAVVALSRGEAKPAAKPEGVCLRCGRCGEVCPMRLEPGYLRQLVRGEQWQALEQAHIASCIRCGACAYACPARIHLTESIEKGKRHILEADSQRVGEQP